MGVKKMSRPKFKKGVLFMKNDKVKVQFEAVKILFVLGMCLLFLQGPMAVYGKTSDSSFKMISTIEYSGKGQYRSQTENTYTIRKENLPNNVVNYTISPKSDNIAAECKGRVPKEMVFSVDKNTRQMLSQNPELSFLETINNQCIRNLKKITSQDIGKSWEQTFSLSAPGYELPEQIKFSLNATGFKTNENEMIAVRALSEPFTVNISGPDGKTEAVKCTINAVYLFDTDVEEIYLSVSVFDATTKMNGYDEHLRNEVATYRFDEEGNPVNLSGISKDFEQLIRKLGLKRDELKVTQKVELPQWIKSSLVNTVEAANISAATACEGALNPVITICAASAQTFQLQSAGCFLPIGPPLTVSKMLVQTIPGIGSMKIAVVPAIMGIGAGNIGIIAGATAGGVAIAENNRGENRSDGD
jgi:hypothetical protein